MNKHEFWDVGEEFHTRPPNLGRTSTAKVMQALIKLRGRLHCYTCDRSGPNDIPDMYHNVVYRISLPTGSKEEFEKLSGYILTPPAHVGVS